MESASHLDVMRVDELIDAELYARGVELLERMYPRYPIYRAVGGDGITAWWNTPMQTAPIAAGYGLICSADSLGWANA